MARLCIFGVLCLVGVALGQQPSPPQPLEECQAPIQKAQMAVMSDPDMPKWQMAAGQMMHSHADEHGMSVGFEPNIASMDPLVQKGLDCLVGNALTEVGHTFTSGDCTLQTVIHMQEDAQPSKMQFCPAKHDKPCVTAILAVIPSLLNKCFPKLAPDVLPALKCLLDSEDDQCVSTDHFLVLATLQAIQQVAAPWTEPTPNLATTTILAGLMCGVLGASLAAFILKRSSVRQPALLG